MLKSRTTCPSPEIRLSRRDFGPVYKPRIDALYLVVQISPPHLRCRRRSHESGLDAVNDAICAILGIGPGDFKSNGYSPNLCCIIKAHEGDKENPSAGWHKDSHFKCLKCHGPREFLNTIEAAEILEIVWRASATRRSGASR